MSTYFSFYVDITNKYVDLLVCCRLTTWRCRRCCNISRNLQVDLTRAIREKTHGTWRKQCRNHQLVADLVYVVLLFFLQVNFKVAENSSSICFERVKAAFLTCGHTFCMVCATQFESNEKSCPICRSHIDSVFPLFV